MISFLAKNSYRFSNHSLPWLLSLGLAAVLMSTDIYAPCLPLMVQEFQATEAVLQWTISLNAIGYCLASPIVGPLSDTYGRKKVLIITLFFYTLATLGCALAPSVAILHGCRFVQGIFSAALPIVSIAMIADVMSGRKLGSVMAYMGIIITLSFAVAPLIGGWVGEHYHWRALFYGLATLSALFCVIYLFLPETIRQPARFSLQAVAKTYHGMIKDKVFLLLGLMTACSLAGFFAYISASSYLYIDQFGMTPSAFGIVTAIGMVTNSFAHLVVGKLITRFGTYKVLRAGIFLVTTSAVLMSIMTFLDVHSAYILLVPVLFYNASLGFIFPPATTMALERYAHCAGAASAFLGTLRMLFLGLGAYLAGLLYNGTLVSISSLLILFAGFVVICFMWSSVFMKKGYLPKGL